MDVIVSALLGGLVVYFGIKFFSIKKSKARIRKESIVLVNSIEKVCKLVSVEGNFSEIHTKKVVKQYFLNLIPNEKKAVLTVNAKVQIGYDLSLVKVLPNIPKKTISILDFPSAKLLSIDLDAAYYDKTEGFLNKFSADDLTELNMEVKQAIIDKIPKSGLLELANKEMLQNIENIETLAATIGWKLDKSSLETKNRNLKLPE